MDKLCCGCCTCCPKWARWCSCILLLILIGLGIAVGVLAALFKVPQVEFNGLKDTPQSSVQGSQLNFTFALNIGVNNPNIESVTFESIVAKASYPNYPTLNLGGGELDNVHINNNGITNITFPFALSLDTVSPDYAGILSDLLSKCGFGGAAKQDITVDYAVTLTVRIIGIAIRPTINNKANFPCPLQVNK
ncbi:hypothetical protein BDF14DRAFT_1715994 [Spinellus fusiger]|nr:hypothetical protein BDF14DRAFT_1715994 [Spinellus fusiger]